MSLVRILDILEVEVMAIAMVSTQQLALLLCNPYTEDHLESTISDTIDHEDRKRERMRRQRSFDDLTSELAPQRDDGGVCIEGSTATHMVRPRSTPPGEGSPLGMDNDSDDSHDGVVASRVRGQHEDDSDSDTTEPEPAQSAQKLRLTIATTRTSDEDANVLESAIWQSLKADAKAGMIPACRLMLAHGRSGAVAQRIQEKELTDDCDNETRHHLREKYQSIERVRDRSTGMRLSPLRKQKYSRRVESAT